MDLYMYILIMCTLIYKNKILKQISSECCNVFMSTGVCCEVADTGGLFRCPKAADKIRVHFQLPPVVFWGLYSCCTTGTVSSKWTWCGVGVNFDAGAHHLQTLVARKPHCSFAQGHISRFENRFKERDRGRERERHGFTQNNDHFWCRFVGAMTCVSYRCRMSDGVFGSLIFFCRFIVCCSWLVQVMLATPFGCMTLCRFHKSPAETTAYNKGNRWK